MKQKITNDAKAWARSIAETRGKNAHWAEKAVVGSDSITAKNAVAMGVALVLLSVRFGAGLPLAKPRSISADARHGGVRGGCCHNPRAR